MRYLVQSISTFHQAHVVEAENEEQAKAIVHNSDENWQKWKGLQFVGITPFDQAQDTIKALEAQNETFWSGYSYMKDGKVEYQKV
jgi:hypothetical protein